MGGTTGQNAKGTVLCHWRAREPRRAREVKVRAVPLVVLTVSKVESPCAESRGYEWDSKDGDDRRGWKDAMGSGGMSNRTGRAEWRSLDFGEHELMRNQPALSCP